MYSSEFIREILREELRAHLPPEPPPVLRRTKVTLIELIEIAGLLTILALVFAMGLTKILAAFH